MSNKVYLQSVFGYREDTLENWLFHNPILEKGEVSIVRDGVDGEWLKIGDGVTRWENLPYKKGPQGVPGPAGAPGPAGDDYILTGADKEEIADMAKPQIDQTYNPESENAQSGKAVAEALASFDRRYELIETVTIAEEGITSIIRNSEPNGKDYSFKDVFVNFKWEGSAPQKWVLLETTANGKKYSAFRTLMATNGGYSWIRTICCYGHRLYVFSERTTNPGFAAFTAAVPYTYANTSKPITSLMVQYETAIPLNTTIEIWGVRA